MSSAQLSSCLYLAEPPNGGRHSDRVPTAVAAGGGGVSIAENCEMDLKKWEMKSRRKLRNWNHLIRERQRQGGLIEGEPFIYSIFLKLFMATAPS